MIYPRQMLILIMSLPKMILGLQNNSNSKNLRIRIILQMMAWAVNTTLQLPIKIPALLLITDQGDILTPA